MNAIEAARFANFAMAGNANSENDYSSVPKIVKNIQKVSDSYRDYVQTEINEELDNQSKQAEKIAKVRKKKDN